jgi:hypothetical protein
MITLQRRYVCNREHVTEGLSRTIYVCAQIRVLVF